MLRILWKHALESLIIVAIAAVGAMAVFVYRNGLDAVLSDAFLSLAQTTAKYYLMGFAGCFAGLSMDDVVKGLFGQQKPRRGDNTDVF